jgi:hypothetical protein
MSRPACSKQPAVTEKVVVEVGGVADVGVDDSSCWAIARLLIAVLGPLREEPDSNDLSGY